MIQRAGSIVHIGFHKTGTTSIQHVLDGARDALLQAGCAFYSGRHFADNHVELHAAAMRLHRPSTFRLGSGLVFDETYRRTVAQELAAFGAAHTGRACLFSAEGVCLLRHGDEVAWLRNALPQPVRIIACLREKAAYRASYRAQLERVRDLWGGAIQREEYNYTEDDSWLWDYDARLAPFREGFGSDSVTVLDYDALTAAHGSIVPGFLEAIGLGDALPPQAWAGLFLNTRKARGSL
ncbi:hypothetical protein [Roseixanthobacter glucoisosaccharinicivorans]|uniref:hypothetical protein n=1 Tax=Roseixanthobacter glucoisosaccharinicivorans TaxID=3119923 RepID=UPI00372BD750